jgi:hypothetical protein
MHYDALTRYLYLNSKEGSVVLVTERSPETAMAL